MFALKWKKHRDKWIAKNGEGYEVQVDIVGGRSGVKYDLTILFCEPNDNVYHNVLGRRVDFTDASELLDFIGKSLVEHRTARYGDKSHRNAAEQNFLDTLVRRKALFGDEDN